MCNLSGGVAEAWELMTSEKCWYEGLPVPSSMEACKRGFSPGTGFPCFPGETLCSKHTKCPQHFVLLTCCADSLAIGWVGSSYKLRLL